MKHILKFAAVGLFFSTLPVFAQVPVATQVAILRAEDSRDYDGLKPFIFSKNLKIQERALLAAARIGEGSSVDALAGLLENGDPSIRPLAAFALGETEAEHAAVFILRALSDTKTTDAVRARAVEAAGKIAAANPKDNDFKALGTAILDVLNAEAGKEKKQNRETILLALTAALRARPEGVDVVTAKFLTNSDAAIRASAGNTMARLRGKNANATLRTILVSDTDPSARANAARALGAGEDKEALDLLLKAAINDADSRVRVSAIRSLGSLKDAKAADKLLEYGEKLLVGYKSSKFGNPIEKSELLEIASVLGNLLPNSDNANAIKFVSNFRDADKYRSPETEIAYARISPKAYLDWKPFNAPKSGGFIIAFPNIGIAMEFADGLGGIAQALAEIVDNKSGKTDEKTIQKAKENTEFLYGSTTAAGVLMNPDLFKKEIAADRERLIKEISNLSEEKRSVALNAYDTQLDNANIVLKKFINAYPDILRALAKVRTEKSRKNIAELLVEKGVVIFEGKDGKSQFAVFEPENKESKEFYSLRYFNKDVIVRATAAELVGEMPDLLSADLLSEAYDYSVANDKQLNEAQLAILDAIAKQKGPEVNRVLLKALDSPDYLVRKKAAQIIRDGGLQNEIPNADAKVGPLRAYDPKTETKQGQILLSDADYKAAAERKNGSIKAIFTTEKGTFTIDLLPEDAPLTVDNFVKLANAKYFNGLEVHRVVPNFVMQDGDPRGDGNGGPGWSIRCEMNMVPFDRGVVGMALSGKDTGGSQWFVTHSPQPHLDGGYTVFGRVNEAHMKVVDTIVRGDKILKVRIVETNTKR